MADGTDAEVGCAANVESGANVFVAVRPEKVAVTVPGAPLEGGELKVAGRLELETFGGTAWRYDIATSNGLWQVALGQRLDVRVGDIVDVRWRPSEAWTVPA